MKNLEKVIEKSINLLYTNCSFDKEYKIKDLFVNYILDRDLIPTKEELNSILEKEIFSKILNRIRHEAEVFTIEKNKIIEETFSMYKEKFTKEFNNLVDEKALIINKVRKEIIQIRNANPQKISPKKCTIDEFEILSKNFIKKYERTRKIGWADAEIDAFSTIDLVDRYVDFLGLEDVKVPDFVENFKKDQNLIKCYSFLRREKIKAMTTSSGVTFYAVEYYNSPFDDEQFAKVIKFIYIDDITEELRVFTPLKGNFINLYRMEVLNYNINNASQLKDSINYLVNSYPEQIKSLFGDINREELEEKFKKYLYLFEYNKKVCLDEFEQASK